MEKRIHDLSELSWDLTGWTPYVWRFEKTMETGASPHAEIQQIPARVPGSVQSALLGAGLLPDWNVGLNANCCEWVEHRHWMYETTIPDDWIEPGRSYRLRCDGLDYSGWLIVNGHEVGLFKGSFVPHVFDISSQVREHDNALIIVFDCPPTWLGQFGYTSRMNEWKPRFNYTWDWTSRLVQIGIWDSISIESICGDEIERFCCSTRATSSSSTGEVHLSGSISARDGSLVRLAVTKDGALVREETVLASRFSSSGLVLEDVLVDLWWPNGHGGQPLYELICELISSSGRVMDTCRRTIGFCQVSWEKCELAPEQADPWICLVNGRPVFLQGVNWTPIRPNFADVTENEYRIRLQAYRDMGVNILRVWGGAFLEKEWFYDICDQMGLMVWQEFPLSSSGVDNMPPDDQTSIAELADIAESYVQRRKHHVSLCVWCGGNELQTSPEGRIGPGTPLDATHPTLARLQQVVESLDPDRRFLPASASGPSFQAAEEDFGKGLHWDVHGPWGVENGMSEWLGYWEKDDSLFRSELGAPSASPVDVIRGFLGDCDELPISEDNPFWRRPHIWHLNRKQFISERGREPASLEEYVAWSQALQRDALVAAVEACKQRFPQCGGVIIWMGHDSFPCATNTSILDYYGRPKPAALGLRGVFVTERRDSRHNLIGIVASEPE